MNALFLYNPKDLHAPINGGVQLCSQEFLEILKHTCSTLHFFEVEFSKSIAFKLLFKLKLDNYLFYDTERYEPELLQYIDRNKITHVYINKSELLRFSKVIKNGLTNPPKVIIMSHGNESGDLLGDLTTPDLTGFIRGFLGKIKLGFNLYTESMYRKRYVDMVCVMSEEEASLEKWLGINEVLVIPRIVSQNDVQHSVRDRNIFGFVGTLDHGPNQTALKLLFAQLKKVNFSGKVEIVGGPKEAGARLAYQYDFVTYLGKLDEIALNKAMSTWGFFINPIFFYSRGASMKLAKAIESETPTITTKAGQRGYLWKVDRHLLVTKNNVFDFTEKMCECLQPEFKYEQAISDVIEIKTSGLSPQELGEELKERSLNLIVKD
ncbi:MAG: glycosyltransferase family 1 protein [Sphingobacteriales bacterium]|nr:MAG: glycosyltransferase family 1 protein [Sphingobacteriales bacterium]